MMQQSNSSTSNITKKDCLRDRYKGANLVTQIALEKNRHWFLQKCTEFKRPPQSLRVSKSFVGLPEEEIKKLIQEIESRALLFAIAEKRRVISDLEKTLKETVKESNVQMKQDIGLIILNRKKLQKKIEFYCECEDNKWKDWKRKKNVQLRTCGSSGNIQWTASINKAKRKFRAKVRKLHKKETKLIDAAHYALNNNLVRNLSGIKVPLFSIAILSYGPGWIPPPLFDQNQFNIDALNAANKQVWASIFNDSTSNAKNDVPLSLLKTQVTSPAPPVKDYVVSQVKEDIINFASNLSPKSCKSKLNRYELEGLQWLKNAVKTKKNRCYSG